MAKNRPLCALLTAKAAGIRPGDVLVSINGADVRSLESFLAAVRRHEPGDRLEVVSSATVDA